jgi:tryptophanyl-tRNA synthetase
MTDDADMIANKIRKAKTDQHALPSEPEGLEGRAEAQNLVSIYAALADESIESVLRDVGGRQFSDFKPMLVERATEVLSPISNKMNLIMKDIPELDKILDNGASKAKSIAEPILQKTFDIIGMR